MKLFCKRSNSIQPAYAKVSSGRSPELKLGHPTVYTMLLDEPLSGDASRHVSGSLLA
jgi:hypothetical protein